MTLLEPDRDQIELFVDAVFRHATQGVISMRAFYEEDASKPFRITPTPLTGGLRFLIEVAEDDARRAAQFPKPVVFCPPLASFNDRDRARERDIAEGFALSVELDEHPHEARATLETILGPATCVVKSGGRWAYGEAQGEDKLHLHWRLAKPARNGDLAKLKLARDLAARLVGGDPTSKSVCHPIRWPGSWHRKATPRLCEIETLNADVEIGLDTALMVLRAEAFEAAGDSAKAANGFNETADTAGNEDWHALVGDIISGRSYHTPLVSIAARLVGSGVLAGTVVKMLRGLMSASVGARDARWHARYDAIPRIVASAQEKYAEDKYKDRDFAWSWHFHGEVAPVDSRPWLIELLIPETGTGLLSGQWGTYKSFVAIDLAVAVMTGGTFINFPVMRKGAVLFVALEGENEIAIRLEAAVRAKNLSGRAPFAWTTDCPRLLDPNAPQVLTAMVKQAAERMLRDFGVPVTLVIVDTMAKAAGYLKTGDENDAVTSRTIEKALTHASKETGAFFLGLDHFGKDPTTGTRGSSGKEGNTDVVLALLGDKDQSGAVTNTRLCARKRRSGPNGEEFAFRTERVDMGVDKNGTPITTLVIDWTETADSAPQSQSKNDLWSKSLRLLRQTLMNMIATCGSEQQPYADGPIVRAVDIETVRAEFYKAYPADGDVKARQEVRRKAFGRAVKDAQARNLIGVRDIGATTFLWLSSPVQNA